MPSLRELESSFGRALLGDAQDALLDLIAPDGLAPAARLRIYRNHVLVSLTEALEATYPVVCRLVDERFFRYADQYIRAHPPACRVCSSTVSVRRILPHSTLPAPRVPAGCARLEWAMNRALHADDAAALDAARLGEVPAERIGAVTPRSTLPCRSSVALAGGPDLASQPARRRPTQL
jgi:hypothetical protein